MKKEINLTMIGGLIYSNSEEAINLQSTKRIGEFREGRVYYSPEEALYLKEKYQTIINSGKVEKNFEELLKELTKKDKNLLAKYCAFKDLVNKGYIVKTGLKFGGEYRIYEKSKLENRENHAKWILHVMKEKEAMKMQELSAKSRVAHSTNKKLLLAVVDEQGEITYYEIDWKKL